MRSERRFGARQRVAYKLLEFTGASTSHCLSHVHHHHHHEGTYYFWTNLAASCLFWWYAGAGTGVSGLLHFDYQKTDTCGRCTVAVLGTAPDPLAGVPSPRSYGTERDRNMTEIQSFRGFQSHRERNSEHVILTILSLLYN